jgi:hypothetical protein
VIKGVDAHLKRIGRRLQPGDALSASEVISADESPICESRPRRQAAPEIESAIERVTLVRIGLKSHWLTPPMLRNRIAGSCFPGPEALRAGGATSSSRQTNPRRERDARCAPGRGKSSSRLSRKPSLASRTPFRCGDIATVAARERKSERSIRMTPAAAREEQSWRSPAEHSGNGILTAETARFLRGCRPKGVKQPRGD